MEKYIDLKDTPTRTAFGPKDRHLMMVLEYFNVRCGVRPDSLILEGPEEKVLRAADVIHAMIRTANKRGKLNSSNVRHLIDVTQPSHREARFMKKMPRPLTDGQENYVDSLTKFPVTICTGPAGTGKTFLAAAHAVNALETGQVKRLVLARPAVEAGEKIGYLPGSLEEKVSPYLRPLFDSISALLSPDKVRHYIDNGIIELSPLAFMRGRTLRDCFAILDEAQNTTPAQMLMFLTRFGRNSRMVVCGDADQSDLDETVNGLTDAVRRTRKVGSISHVHLDHDDIVRHSVVSEIVEAYNESA